MKRYINTENYQNNADKLRGHLGNFPAVTGSVNFKDNKITHQTTSDPVINSNKIFPTIEQKIFIYSDESVFRDGVQWREHVKQLITTGHTYVDHSFTTNIRSTECEFHRAKHIPEYEDFGKTLDTNALMNYNVAYTTSESDLIDDMATLKNQYDGEMFNGIFGARGNNKYLRTVIDNYQQRLSLSNVGVENIIAKNKNIYMLNKTNGSKIKLMEPVFPCYIKITSNNHILHNNSLLEIFEDNNYEKLIFQAINNNTRVHNIEFHGTNLIRAHDVVDLFSNLDFKNFKENSNELFLLNKEDSVDNLKNRFVNQINSIKVLGKINTLIQNDLRDYGKIIDSNYCRRYNLGYKIEKYLENTNRSPIQTYYIKNNENYLEHIDTQLKFGKKYVYKVYNISCVLGSSYQYDELSISSFDDESLLLEENYDTSYNYRACAKVIIAPSMKILEIPIHSSTKMFFDIVPPKPWVDFSLSPSGLILRFEPMGFDQLEEYEHLPIHPDESYVKENLELASNGFKSEDRGFKYFSGDYRIYRIAQEPESMEDFYSAPTKDVNNFLEIAQVNETNQQFQPQGKVKQTSVSCEDKILPNKKYYYIFRAKSYHGTLSNPTNIYEVEIVKTASDRLLKVNLFKFKSHTRYKNSKNTKRLIKIEPGYSHMSFPSPNDAASVEEAISSMESTGKKLFSESGNRFKIRLTSKHTGKKIDLNVNFKIIKKTN